MLTLRYVEQVLLSIYGPGAVLSLTRMPGGGWTACASGQGRAHSSTRDSLASAVMDLLGIRDEVRP